MDPHPARLASVPSAAPTGGSVGPLGPTAPAPGLDHYEAGACNIGPAEIARRRRGAWLATVATVVLAAFLFVAGVPPIWRLIVALPAAAAAVSWLQVRLRFCVAFAVGGQYNFGPLGMMRQVIDARARRADLARAAGMIALGSSVGLVVGVVLVLLP
ncbi:MAG: hypothetical protein ACXVAE_00810 [Candidatus Limnocylindrales bacterium]